MSLNTHFTSSPLFQVSAGKITWTYLHNVITSVMSESIVLSLWCVKTFTFANQAA